MQAIILAAGMGRRLGKYTEDSAKCMLPVNGERLIDRVIGQLSSLGVKNITLVIGYKGKKLKEHILSLPETKKLNICFIDNPIYDTTNNIYSLYLAASKLCEEDTLLLESDLIYEDRLLERLINYNAEAVALVDKYDSWMDGTVVTLDEQLYIQEFISKSFFDKNKSSEYYKTVNIYKFSQDFSSSKFLPFLKTYMEVYGRNNYYEGALGILAYLDKKLIKGMLADGARWYEIDNEQDLRAAEEIQW